MQWKIGVRKAGKSGGLGVKNTSRVTKAERGGRTTTNQQLALLTFWRLSG